MCIFMCFVIRKYMLSQKNVQIHQNLTESLNYFPETYVSENLFYLILWTL